MLKYLVLSFILFTAILMPGNAFSQQGGNDRNSAVISGTVVKVYTEGGIIIVQNDNGKMEFHINIETDLSRLDHHISILEIIKGDSVKIQYTGYSGKNEVIKLVDFTES